MNVAEIAERARIEPRAIRYVLDHGIVPAVEKDTEKRGAPRVLNEEEALAVSVSALLLKAGLKRPLVRGLVRGMFERKTGGSSPVAEWLRKQPADDDHGIEEIEIADRRYVRAIAKGAKPGAWLDLTTKKLVSDVYMPLVIAKINLVELRRRLHEE